MSLRLIRTEIKASKPKEFQWEKKSLCEQHMPKVISKLIRDLMESTNDLSFAM